MDYLIVGIGVVMLAAGIWLYGNIREQQLLEEECEDLNLREHAAVIRQQAGKLKCLLDSLVKLFCLKGGMIHTVPRKMDAREVVRKVQALMEQKAKEKKILITAKSEETPVNAWFDEKWTEEALCSLVDHAVKYTLPGGKIVMEIIFDPMYCRIHVRDSGSGIQEEGAGLGLYLAREIVRKEGGDMKISSNKGIESVFSLYLPAGK